MCAEDNMHHRRHSKGTLRPRCCRIKRIKYTVFPYPYDGSDKRTIIVDPRTWRRCARYSRCTRFRTSRNIPAWAST